jgi:hypothetical protein
MLIALAFLFLLVETPARRCSVKKYAEGQDGHPPEDG